MKLLVLVFVLGFTARISPAAEKYALVIGITGYPNFPANERLRFASADAVDIKEFLRTPEAGSFDEDNIRLVVDQNATRDGIYREIKWLSDRVNRDDVFYLFFAGHGVVDGGTGRAYFMPMTAVRSIPQGTGFAPMCSWKISAKPSIPAVLSSSWTPVTQPLLRPPEHAGTRRA